MRYVHKIGSNDHLGSTLGLEGPEAAAMAWSRREDQPIICHRC